MERSAEWISGRKFGNGGFDMSVNIEGNISQAGAASGWYQNSRVASPQEKEKDAPQPKADNAVKVSISQEGIENYRKQTREKGISGRVVAKGNKESVKQPSSDDDGAVAGDPAPGGGVYQDAGALDWTPGSAGEEGWH